MAAPTIIAGLRQVLRPHSPFSGMAEPELDYLLERARLVYCAPGEVILAPSGTAAPSCFIVQQGLVRGLRNGKPEDVAIEAAAGDCFPVGALLAKRPVQLTYVAASSSFLLALPQADFDELTRISPSFLDFCKRRLASLLDLSNQQVQAAYAAQASSEGTLNTPLRDLVRTVPVMCSPDTSLRDALARMHSAQVGSIIVVQKRDEAGAQHVSGETIVGILTLTDLIGRVVLPQVPLDTPIQHVMSKEVRALDAEATAGEAKLLMAQHTIRHVPVTQLIHGQQKLIGVVSERDLSSLKRLSVRQLSAAIRQTGDATALAVVSREIQYLSHHLVAQGVSAQQLSKLIGQLNDQLVQQVLKFAAERFAVPESDFCWLALGSEGRGEQIIGVEQQNALVFADGSNRNQLLEMADWANEALAQCGFPIESARMLARNPRWCVSAHEWANLMIQWIDHGNASSLRDTGNFFDFRPLFGELALAQRLRQIVIDHAARNTHFLMLMRDQVLLAAPARLHGSAIDGSKQEHLEPRELAFPFIGGARVWTLAAGLPQTNTAERLRALAEMGRLPSDDVDSWIAAHEFLQMMQLRQQHQFSGRRAGQVTERRDMRAVPNASMLSALDQRILKEAQRQARKLQQRLELDFPG